MSVPSWPLSLPQRPLQQGYARGFADGRVRQRMGQGASKVRRRFTAAVRLVPLVYQMSTGQMARLERFWEEDTRGGVLPFALPDAVNHEMRLAAEGGPPILSGAVPLLVSAVWLVQFGEDAPRATPISFDRYDVSFSVEVLP